VADVEEEAVMGVVVGGEECAATNADAGDSGAAILIFDGPFNECGGFEEVGPRVFEKGAVEAGEVGILGICGEEIFGVIAECYAGEAGVIIEGLGEKDVVERGEKIGAGFFDFSGNGRGLAGGGGYGGGVGGFGESVEGGFGGIVEVIEEKGRDWVGVGGEFGEERGGEVAVAEGAGLSEPAVEGFAVEERDEFDVRGERGGFAGGGGEGGGGGGGVGGAGGGNAKYETGGGGKRKIRNSKRKTRGGGWGWNLWISFLFSVERLQCVIEGT
jgi:hypothetical protein